MNLYYAILVSLIVISQIKMQVCSACRSQCLKSDSITISSDLLLFHITNWTSGGGSFIWKFFSQLVFMVMAENEFKLNCSQATSNCWQLLLSQVTCFIYKDMWTAMLRHLKFYKLPIRNYTFPNVLVLKYANELVAKHSNDQILTCKWPKTYEIKETTLDNCCKLMKPSNIEAIYIHGNI